MRSYIIQYRNRIAGAPKRLTIGQHGPLLTFDQAKKPGARDARTMQCAARIRSRAESRPERLLRLRILLRIIWKGMRFRRRVLN